MELTTDQTKEITNNQLGKFTSVVEVVHSTMDEELLTGITTSTEPYFPFPENPSMRRVGTRKAFKAESRKEETDSKSPIAVLLMSIYKKPDPSDSEDLKMS
ncbi:hypothetical protein STEG23_029983 [Scotinomys teguina]